MANELGDRLRLLRGERDLTLAEVSEETGISVSTLSRLESGGRKATLELLLPLGDDRPAQQPSGRHPRLQAGDQPVAP